MYMYPSRHLNKLLMIKKRLRYKIAHDGVQNKHVITAVGNIQSWQLSKAWITLTVLIAQISICSLHDHQVSNEVTHWREMRKNHPWNELIPSAAMLQYAPKTFQICVWRFILGRNLWTVYMYRSYCKSQWTDTYRLQYMWQIGNVIKIW